MLLTNKLLTKWCYFAKKSTKPPLEREGQERVVRREKEREETFDMRQRREKRGIKKN